MALKCEGTLPVRCLGLKDETKAVKVALFQDLAKQEYMYLPDTVVEFSGLYKKMYAGQEQLVASRLTEFQVYFKWLTVICAT